MAAREASRSWRWAKRSSREGAGLSVFGGIVWVTRVSSSSRFERRTFLSARCSWTLMFERLVF